MITVLAESIDNVDPGFLKNWVIVGLVVLAAADRLYSIAQRRKNPATVTYSAPVPELPQPIRIKHEETYVTAEAFRDIKEKVDGLPAMERRLNENGEARALAIHNRINPLAEAVEGTRLQFEAMQRHSEQTNALIKTVLRHRSP